jgi:ectoine hydroxylase-related dioxygenase (phytanoyl-CoA dioxygenase family)
VLDEQQWQRFSLDGYLPLGRVLTGPELEALRARADELARGTVVAGAAGGEADGGLAEAGAAATGEVSERPRVLQGLEHDEVFRPLVAHQLFLEVCGRMYAPHAAVSVFHAMVLEDPAGAGEEGVAAWSQDGGEDWQLDRDPLVTLWVALDDAAGAGRIEAVRGSHRSGLLSARGGELSEQDAAIHCDADRLVALEVPEGHALLLHSWLIRRASANRSATPRRAFTGCYLDGRTINVTSGSHYPVVAGTVDQAPHPYIGTLASDRAAAAENARVAQERAASLESELAAVRERCEAAEGELRSLEDERERASRERTRLPGRAAQWLRSLRHRGSGAAPTVE